MAAAEGNTSGSHLKGSPARVGSVIVPKEGSAIDPKAPSGGSGSGIAGVAGPSTSEPVVEKEDSSSEEEFLEVVDNKGTTQGRIDQRKLITVTKLDTSLLELEDDRLEEILEKLSSELSNIEVRRSELENLDRQLDEDKASISDAIRKGVHEKESLRKEIEDLRLEAKNMRDQLVKNNKDRQGDESHLANFQKQLIVNKDHFEDTVWSRVDLEDILRKLDRDLIIVKNKQAELAKANAATAALEQKLQLLTSVASTKMKEAAKIDGYRENFRRRLDAISISLHHHSSDRSDMAFELEHQRRLIEFRKASRNTSEQLISQTGDLILRTQADLERAIGSQELYLSEVELSLAALRARCEANSRVTGQLQAALTSHLRARQAATVQIQKVNHALERYCALFRGNKTFTPEDNKQILALTGDLDITLQSLREFESVRHIGLDRTLEINSMHRHIDECVLQRNQLTERIASSSRLVKQCHQMFIDVFRNNQALSAQLAAAVAERKKLEARLG